MRSTRGLAPAVLLCALVLAAALEAQGAPQAARDAALYVNRVVVAPQGDVGLASLVRASGPLSPAAQEAMSHSVTVLNEKVQYLPTTQYMPQIEAAFGTDAVIVGSRTLLIPKGSSAESQTYLIDRLADFLVSQGYLDDGKVEFSFTQGSLKGAPPQDGIPSCQVVKSSRGVEVSFLLTGSTGNSVSGRITLPPAAAGVDAPGAVKTNEPVRVVFRKGPITVEMPGKALAAATVGDNVSVFIAESQKKFTGRVVDGKAVQVDLP